MSHYTGPKNRLSRREGLDMFGKGNKLRRATVPPGQHGQKGARRMTGFGIQLREKQKTKRIYGTIEGQFHRYFELARKVRGATGENLLRLLETRLDNIVYRLGFAKTRSMARQLVGHGHVLVNGKILTIPSYQVSIGQTIALDQKSLAQAMAKVQDEEDHYQPPVWLTKQGAIGKVESFPTRAQIDTPVDEQLIVEYYSKQ